MNTRYGVYPEEQSIERQPDGTVKVLNRYYEIAYDSTAGGAISAVTFKRLAHLNAMAATGSFEIGLSGGPALKAGACRKIKMQDGVHPVVEFTAPLCDTQKKPSGGFLVTRYEHHWGYVRIRQELQIPRGGWRVQWLLLQNWIVNPVFSSYGIRPGIGAEASCLPGAWGGIAWGRFNGGSAFDTLYTSRFVPRYMALLDPGRVGIEWFVGSQLAQWDYQLVGEPGHGSLCIAPGREPAGTRVRICPLDLAQGWKRLAGRLVFDSYVGIPILTGRANPPFLDEGFNRKNWPTTEKIAGWARRGVTNLRFHHDGDIYQDGLFWRDGQYPPFGPADLREYDRVIRDCHRHGLRVITYFSNKELNPSLPAFKQFGKAWARTPTDRRDLLFNRAGGGMLFGAQMCLRSGWLDYLKNYIDTVLTHHALDGTYYDWNSALYCHNPLHVGLKPQAPRFGGLAQSPAGHWDVDEFLDLMEWTRRRVGPAGSMVIHNSTTPMAAAENFADSVVTMEWGYTHLQTGVPAPAELPPEWNFMGSRSRAIIGYGSVAHDAAPLVRKRFRTLTLLTGVAPWTATDDDLAAFKPLHGLAFPRYRFWDCQRSQVACSAPDCGAAVYAGREELILVLGNYGRVARQVHFDFNPRRFGVRIGSSALRAGACGRSGVGGNRGMLRLTVRLPGGAARIVKWGPDVLGC